MNDRQNPDLATRCQVVMNEVHRPDMVGMGRFRAVSPQLRLYPALGNPVAELEVHLLVKTIDSLRIGRPKPRRKRNPAQPQLLFDKITDRVVPVLARD